MSTLLSLTKGLEDGSNSSEILECRLSKAEIVILKLIFYQKAAKYGEKVSEYMVAKLNDELEYHLGESTNSWIFKASDFSKKTHTPRPNYTLKNQTAADNSELSIDSEPQPTDKNKIAAKSTTKDKGKEKVTDDEIELDSGTTENIEENHVR